LDPEVFVFAAANREARQNRAATIDQPVPVREIRAHAIRAGDGLSKRRLREVRCWGSLPSAGNLGSWSRMDPGHWGLLYSGDGRFPSLLRVASKTRHKGLARHLWGQHAGGDTWELMFFFDRIRQVDLDIDEVRAAFVYGDEWWPRGLQYPGPEQQAMLLEKFGSVEAWASASGEPGTSDADAAPTPEELLFGGPFPGVPTKPPRAPRRRRQPDPDVSGRGYLAHERTVGALEDHLGRSAFHKGTQGINHDGGWTAGGEYCICEVKSITDRNEVSQLQKGLGQVLHNRFKAEEHGIERIRAYLIAEREPSNSELWKQLADRHGVVFSWPECFAADIRTP
jgi:hypothetical protein